MSEYAVPATGVLIQKESGEVFLMKSPKWENRWVVPGGKVEKGDSVKETVRKEVREETGLEVSDIEFHSYQDLGQPEEFSRNTQFVFLNFICTADTEDVELDDREAADYIWKVPGEALEDLELNESTRKFVEAFSKE
ncbi:MAG: NUDIX domain-containing protein [Candidatus Nanohaloarchaea archaeon]